jgi:hypothetical protein
VLAKAATAKLIKSNSLTPRLEVTLPTAFDFKVCVAVAEVWLCGLVLELVLEVEVEDGEDEVVVALTAAGLVAVTVLQYAVYTEIALLRSVESEVQLLDTQVEM